MIFKTSSKRSVNFIFSKNNYSTKNISFNLLVLYNLKLYN